MYYNKVHPQPSESEALRIQKNVHNRNVRIHVRKGIDDPKTIVAAGVDISDGKLKVRSNTTIGENNVLISLLDIFIDFFYILLF